SPRRSAQRSAHCVSREVVVSTTVESAFEIRPFHIDVPQEELDGLRSRIEATRFVDEETVGDQSQGVQFGDDSETRALVGDGVRLAQVRGEAECPAQFVTEIDGLNIHFIHVRSKHDDASRGTTHSRTGSPSAPFIEVPAISIASDFDGAAIDGKAYRDR